MKKCPYCGLENPDGSSKCQTCQADLEPSAASVPFWDWGVFGIIHSYVSNRLIVPLTGLVANQKRWWSLLVFGMESYIVLASVAFIVAVVWSGDHLWWNTELVHRLCFVIGGYAFCFVTLMTTSFILIICRQKKSGWVALSFAIFAILFLAFFLPCLAKSR